MSVAQPILMPKFGQTVEECTVVEWHKKEGDKVSRGDVIFEVETEKATLEVESFQEGTLLKILVHEGESAQVQTPVAFIGQQGDKFPDIKEIMKQVAAQQPVSPKPVAQPGKAHPLAAAETAIAAPALT